MEPQVIPQQDISLSGITGGGEIDIYQYFTASPYFAGFKGHNTPEMKYFLGVYKNLPDSLRQFIASDTTASILFTIGQSFNLDDEQIFILAKSVRELVIGNIFIKEFPTTLSSRLAIDDIKSSEIVNSIVSRSFAPIIEDIKRIQRSKFPEKILQLQKEARPEGLTAKPSSVSPDIKNTPLNKVPENKPELKNAPRPKPAINNSPGPAQPQPLPKPSFQPQPPKPEQIQKPAEPKPPLMPKPPVAPQVPAQNPAPPKPQFKIPDLGQNFSPVTEPLTPRNKPAPPGGDLNKSNNVDSLKSAQKSLEDELQKVASVIDLRSKPEK